MPKEEQTIPVDWIKGSVKNSPRNTDYSRHLKKTGRHNSQNSVITWTTKMKTLVWVYQCMIIILEKNQTYFVTVFLYS